MGYVVDKSLLTRVSEKLVPHPGRTRRLCTASLSAISGFCGTSECGQLV